MKLNHIYLFNIQGVSSSILSIFSQSGVHVPSAMCLHFHQKSVSIFPEYK